MKELENRWHWEQIKAIIIMIIFMVLIVKQWISVFAGGIINFIYLVVIPDW